MRATRAWYVVFVLGAFAFACDPENPCDPGYYADHGVCLRTVEAPRDDADGGADDSGANEYAGGDESAFGRPCQTREDCGGSAPECGGPMLPMCTAVNCQQGASRCPADWTCLDVSGLDRPDPEVKSLCIRL